MEMIAAQENFLRRGTRRCCFCRPEADVSACRGGLHLGAKADEIHIWRLPAIVDFWPIFGDVYVDGTQVWRQ
ncbi:MAG: hypothetical protein WCD16_10665 [Paracoccaceae bacterium]